MGIQLCTLFDRNYLAKGIALINSLARHEPDAHLYILCCDDYVWRYFSNKKYENITPIPLPELEVSKELTRARGNRSRAEYLFTLSSSLMLFVLHNVAGLRSVAYIDADNYLFSSLGLLYQEVANTDIAVIHHRWCPQYTSRLRVNGEYNVSWVYVNRTVAGRQFLAEWSRKCLDWCYQRPEGGKYADQGYLNELVPKYNAHIVQHLGTNLAPWSQEQYNYSLRDGQIFVEEDPLLFFHFHEYSHSEQGQTTRRTGYQLHPFVVENVYPPYEREIAQICRELTK